MADQSRARRLSGAGGGGLFAIFVTLAWAGGIAFVCWESFLSGPHFAHVWAQWSALLTLGYGAVFVVANAIQQYSKENWIVALVSVIIVAVFAVSGTICWQVWNRVISPASSMFGISAGFFADRLVFLVIAAAFLIFDGILALAAGQRRLREFRFFFVIDLPTFIACCLIFLVSVHDGSVDPAVVLPFIAGANAFQMIASNTAFSILLLLHAFMPSFVGPADTATAPA